jgi:hypothetical protein
MDQRKAANRFLCTLLLMNVVLPCCATDAIAGSQLSSGNRDKLLLAQNNNGKSTTGVGVSGATTKSATTAKSNGTTVTEKSNTQATNSTSRTGGAKAPATTSSSSTATPPSATRLQGGVKRKGKFKETSAPSGQLTGARNPYSITQPYNPNNPPPIENKIHPISSNNR